MWSFGEVIDSIDNLIPALERAPSIYRSRIAIQKREVINTFTDLSEDTAE